MISGAGGKGSSWKGLRSPVIPTANGQHMAHGNMQRRYELGDEKRSNRVVSYPGYCDTCVVEMNGRRIVQQMYRRHGKSHSAVYELTEQRNQPKEIGMEVPVVNCYGCFNWRGFASWAAIDAKFCYAEHRSWRPSSYGKVKEVPEVANSLKSFIPEYDIVVFFSVDLTPRVLSFMADDHRFMDNLCIAEDENHRVPTSGTMRFRILRLNDKNNRQLVA
ncbi:hypothetical protein T10_3063 [Trichinella papuae]|uniref:Uncharacterized protein n=1 Tax=Trichinella papuae TaxID=268474 RepID=A0A0V1M8U2_9BILA|nr:hypothetical protein T10_3063 [Trichinella papuae]